MKSCWRSTIRNSRKLNHCTYWKDPKQSCLYVQAFKHLKLFTEVGVLGYSNVIYVKSNYIYITVTRAINELTTKYKTVNKIKQEFQKCKWQCKVSTNIVAFKYAENFGRYKVS